MAEVKGITSSPGLDITLYGQLFRRMTDLDGTSYTVSCQKSSSRLRPTSLSRCDPESTSACSGSAWDDAVREH